MRALAVWFFLLVSAFVNGFVREALLSPLLGPAAAHVVCTIMLVLLIAAITWLGMPWIAPKSARSAFGIGALWLALTLAFEFLAGHYLFGNSWEHLLAEYNVLAGRIWIVVPIVTLFAPLAVWPMRRYS